MSRHVQWRAACRSLGFQHHDTFESFHNAVAHERASRDHAGRGARSDGSRARRNRFSAGPDRGPHAPGGPLASPKTPGPKSPSTAPTPVARHDGDRRGSPWFSWRAIAVGCVLGALAVLAVLRAFPSVAAAVVPTPGPAVAAPREAGPSASLAVEPSAKAESFADIVRAHHAKHLEDAKASSGRRRASSDSKLGTHADADERSVGLGVSAHETDLREPTVGRGFTPSGVVIVVAVFATPTRARRNTLRPNPATKRITGVTGRARPRGEPPASGRARARRHEELSREEKERALSESSAEPRSRTRLRTYVSAALGDAAASD